MVIFLLLLLLQINNLDNDGTLYCAVSSVFVIVNQHCLVMVYCFFYYVDQIITVILLLFLLLPIYIATVLVLIKLTKFAAVLRLRCGSCKLIF